MTAGDSVSDGPAADGNGADGVDPADDEDRASGVEPSADPTIETDEAPSIEEGRYVYCAVRIDDGDEAEFSATGVDDEPVSLVAIDGIGAVVHECEEIYDSADFEQIRRWLVRHQSVIDEAAEAFGTPLPFQFDTVVRGDDETVREWLREEREAVAGALSSLAEHWEYRIEVVRTEPVDEETLAADDERLADLRERIDEATEGTAHLLERKYEQRLEARRTERRAALTDDLRARIAEHAREVHELDRSPATALEGGNATDGDDDRETICRLTVLAHADEEDAIGSILDDVAAEPGIEVRFTGPWPPYTFAPALGEETDDGAGPAGAG